MTKLVPSCLLMSRGFKTNREIRKKSDRRPPEITLIKLLQTLIVFDFYKKVCPDGVSGHPDKKNFGKNRKPDVERMFDHEQETFSWKSQRDL